jgi:hypothetical protein
MMIKFNKPENLNGAELLQELANVGIVLEPIIQSPIVDGNGNLWLDIDSADESKAAAVVAAHNGNTVAPEPSIGDKLASVGVSIDDLKAALSI